MLTMMVVINSILVLLSHPLTIGLTLIAQTLLIASSSNLTMGHAWFSYLLVLVFLGGLLILFIYVSTLASNEQLNMKLPVKWFSLFLATSLGLTTLISWNTLSSSDNAFAEPTTFLFTPTFTSMSSFILAYLFIVLVAVVKITKFWSGTLRPLN